MLRVLNLVYVREWYPGKCSRPKPGQADLPRLLSDLIWAGIRILNWRSSIRKYPLLIPTTIVLEYLRLCGNYLGWLLVLYYLGTESLDLGLKQWKQYLEGGLQIVLLKY